MFMTALIAVLMTASPNPKEADALFSKARTLMKEGNAAHACPLFEKSHALDPALGTLLNLGDCYEVTGRRVQAFLSFNEAAAWATRNHEAGRAEIARARAGALKGRLSWLALSPAAPTPGLVVTVNDFVVELGTAAQSVPVDPGTLKIIASAPDREGWTTTVTVAQMQTVAVAVPALAPVAELKTPEVRAFEATLTPVPMVESETLTPLVRVERAAPPSASRTPAVALMAGGAVLAATGLAGLAWSFETYGRFQQQQDPSFPQLTVTRGDFNTLKVVYPASWAVAGVGVAAAAAGGFLYWKNGRTLFTFVPTSQGAAFAASGSF